MPEYVMPQAMKRGDRVRVVAPAGPSDATLFWRGVGWLSQHFRVTFASNVRARDGFVAGPRARRLLELNTALGCPETRAVFCARGGYGSAELLDGLDLTRFRQHPKWLVGFSDVTALHLELQRHGFASLHGPNVTTLGRAHACLREPLLDCLLTPARPRSVAGLEMLNPGTARGPLVGGNLSLVHDYATRGRGPWPVGSLLFVEEVGEAPYRIARTLEALREHGLFDRVAGLIVGQISASFPGAYGTDAKAVFTRLARSTGLPCAWGAPSGHELGAHWPLILGQYCELHYDGQLALGCRTRPAASER